MTFEFNAQISQCIRNQANQNGISPSDQIRAIIGLQIKKPKRPRLTVSLSEMDYAILANRYGLAAKDHEAIRQAIADELINYSEKTSQTTKKTGEILWQPFNISAMGFWL